MKMRMRKSSTIGDLQEKEYSDSEAQLALRLRKLPSLLVRENTDSSFMPNFARISGMQCYSSIYANTYCRSPGSPGSVNSGDMQHSDSEADAAGEDIDDDAPLYPVDGQFTSTADRAHILGLPEIEREQILAERATEITRIQQDKQLKRALAGAREKAKSHKRKADTDLDDGIRKSSKAKTEKRSALDDYKRAREQREAGKTRVDTRYDRRDERSASYPSDRDADGESDVEFAEPSDLKREEPPADLRDFNRAHVGRSNFAKVCFYPNFENAVKGCFARVSIGPDRATGQNVYRMAQIKGMREPSMIYNCTQSLTSCRLHRGQALQAHISERETVHHRPIRPCRSRKLREAMALPRML